MARVHIRKVIINTANPARAAAFWATVLGVDVPDHLEDVAFVWLEPDEPGGVRLGLQRVDHPSSGASRIHLDIAVDDLEAQQAVIESLGGALCKANLLESGFEWRVMTDPDGNEFCIFVE